MDGLELLDLTYLCLLQLLVLKQLLPLFQDVFTHLHGLLEILVAVLQDLFECLLIQLNHPLLIFKHFARLISLLLDPFVVVPRLLGIMHGHWLGKLL
jgi:hypothetical protein